MNLILEKIKQALKSIFNTCWNNLPYILVILLVLDLGLGIIFFFNYYMKTGTDLQTHMSLKINQDMVNNLSSKYNEREADFNKVQTGIYVDIFRGFD